MWIPASLAGSRGDGKSAGQRQGRRAGERASFALDLLEAAVLVVVAMLRRRFI
jgi:hypothetical protein